MKEDEEEKQNEQFDLLHACMLHTRSHTYIHIHVTRKADRERDARINAHMNDIIAHREHQ